MTESITFSEPLTESQIRRLRLADTLTCVHNPNWNNRNAAILEGEGKARPGGRRNVRTIIQVPILIKNFVIGQDGRIGSGSIRGPISEGWNKRELSWSHVQFILDHLKRGDQIALEWHADGVKPVGMANLPGVSVDTVYLHVKRLSKGRVIQYRLLFFEGLIY